MDQELKEYLEQQFKSIRSEMATKDELSKMATKDDLKAIRGEMGKEFKAVRAEMVEMREGIVRQIGVLHEDVLKRIDTVVEGFQVRTEIDEKLKKEINDTDQRVEKLRLELIAHKTDAKAHEYAA